MQMKCVSGEITLDKFIGLLRKKIEESVEYKNRPKSLAVKKLMPPFYDMLLLKPFLLYVPKGTLVNNNSYDELERFLSDIFYIDDIYTMIICMNLSLEEMKNYNAKWIVCEAEKRIKKSRVFQQVPFLDYFMSRKKDGRNATSGKLDFIKLDEMYFDYHKKYDLKKYLQKAGEYFYTNIFSLNLTERKEAYAKRELKYFEHPNMIKISDKNIEKLYIYDCPICETRHRIWLAGNEKSNVKNYIKQNGQYIDFACKHLDTDFAGFSMLGFDALKHEFSLQADEQYNQAFLYLFYGARHNKGNIEFKNKEGKNTIKTISRYDEIRRAK